MKLLLVGGPGQVLAGVVGRLLASVRFGDEQYAVVIRIQKSASTVKFMMMARQHHLISHFL